MKSEKLETISNLFESSEIRSIWDSEKEVSIADVIKALTDSNNQMIIGIN